MNDDLMGAIALAQGEAYSAGVAWGVKSERERIIKLWKQEMNCNCEDAMGHLLALIKGENK